MTLYEAEMRVRSYELDSFRHVNHAVFLNYLEEARFETLRTAGFTYDDIQARGWGIHVVRLEIDYLAELRLPDRVRVLTRVDRYRRTSMTFAQRILRGRTGKDETEVARALVTAVWIGEEGRPMRIPATVREALGEPDPATAW